MRPLIIASLLCLLTFHLRSQIQIEGLVTDAENNKPVDAATVQLQKKGAGYLLIIR